MRQTSWSFVAAWMGLLLLHVASMLYYVGFAFFYKMIYHTNLAFQLLTYSIGIEESQYFGIAWTHAAVASVHGFYILQMVGSSLSAGHVRFHPSTPIKAVVIQLLAVLRRRFRLKTDQVQPRNPSPGLFSAPSLVIVMVGRSVSSVFSRQGLLGVDGVYFDDVLVIRELFESTLQTYQAYRMTRLLPRLAFIRVYVVLLVANCWSVPVVHRIYQGKDKERRMASLLCDAILDTLSSMGITLLIAATYAPQYNDPMFGFPFTNWFNDQWFTAVHQEFQMMLVVSWGDMASRLVFAVGLLQCMGDVKDMLESSPASTNQRLLQATIAVAPAPVASSGGPDRSKLIMTRSVSWLGRLQRARHFLLHVVGPRFFLFWGFTVLIIHSYAESKGTNWPCKLDLRPWLDAKPACSLVEINCNEVGMTGRAASLEAAWTLFDPALTAHLTIRHCPQLVISPAIQQHHQLTSMKVYNSTIVSWPETAAITYRFHSALRAMYFVRTAFVNATLPPGLRTTDFPQSFRSFIVSGSNLASLPDDLHRAWPPEMSIALEGSQFSTVPPVLMDLQPRLVALSFNPITSLPPELFEIPSLKELLLCNIPLQELPRQVASPSHKLYLVMLTGTNVSTLWSWLDPTIAQAFAFHNQFFLAPGTRFCAEREAIKHGLRTVFSAAEAFPQSALASVMDVSTAERLAYSKEAVTCTPGPPAFFPLPLEDLVSAMAQ